MNPVNNKTDKKENPLAAAEMSVEGNYNMIDGIINNAPKPSVLERMKEYERQIAENNKKQVDNKKAEKDKSCPSIEEP
jgi:hypothetical protein